MSKRFMVAVAIVGVASSAAALVKQHFSQVEIVTHFVNPEQLDATAERINALHAPAGFTVTAFATDLGHPRVVAVADDGRVYVTRREPGDILVLRDTNGDGRADEVRVAVRRPMLHGITFDKRKAYFVGVTDVFSADVQSDGTFANVTRLVDDLPDGGQHADRTIRIGPDGQLYISIGSTCNTCNETKPESATIVRMSLDGKSRAIVASGLRNMIGFDWDPATSQMYGMDNGIDFLGDDQPIEEFNAINQGKQYGWPYVYGKSQIYPHGEPPGAMTPEEWAKLSVEPVLTYTAHAAPMDMAFYTGSQFPAEYRGDAFAAMHGSWNRRPPSGYEVVRVRFQDGKPSRIEPFLTGFLTTHEGHPAYFGRPMGVAVARDGALLVSDDANGVIYRVASQAAVNTTASVARPSAAAVGTSGAKTTPANTALAPATLNASGAKLTVTSSAFAAGQAIPVPYSQYGEKFSPPLAWSGAPASTKSFAVIAEDPDAKPVTPFVHWLVYNLPASVTRLHESVPPAPRLDDPANALQGRNSRGQVGYMGPRPPAGDPPHHYHFEVFALDATLSVDPGADREALMKAMAGHVIGTGETVGTFAAPR
jgi:Raf kinase inhibitor-like YbhB/YbcL family protein